MQESWKFNLSEDIRLDEKEDLKHKIKTALKAQQKELGIFLSYYYKADGAVVEEVEVEDFIELNSSGSGKVLLSFRLIFYNACLNIHEKEKDKMELEFSIDKKEKKLQLTGPFVPERGMDEI
ncbi:hypothetical protein GCM10028791_01840 [Echinicola sediminis]